ncbi:malonate-semialdehyde dehydrogenase, partial [Pseudomonas sp. RTC3]|nr:malonate-semialdehyde dehydrogenase [Pseudomonas sp. RTC3]
MNASLKPSINKNGTAVARVKLLIGGEWVDSQTNEWHDIDNPATQEVLAQVPFATES